MKLKAVSGIMLILLLTGMLTLAFDIQLVRSDSTGDNMWKKYLKTDVYEDYNTYIPTPQDFDEYVGLVADSSTLVPETYSDEWSKMGFRTWVYVSEPKDISIGIGGDDGVGLYLDDNFVCGRGNAEDPMSYGTMVLSAGWHKVEALVYNGGVDIWLEFDKKISDYVDVMNSEQIPLSPDENGDGRGAEQLWIIVAFVLVAIGIIVGIVAVVVKRRKSTP